MCRWTRSSLRIRARHTHALHRDLCQQFSRNSQEPSARGKAHSQDVAPVDHERQGSDVNSWPPSLGPGLGWIQLDSMQRDSPRPHWRESPGSGLASPSKDARGAQFLPDGPGMLRHLQRRQPETCPRTKDGAPPFRSPAVPAMKLASCQPLQRAEREPIDLQPDPSAPDRSSLPSAPRRRRKTRSEPGARRRKTRTRKKKDETKEKTDGSGNAASQTTPRL